MPTKVELATKYAWSFVGLPYKWGGDDPLEGFDCSGYCIEILKAVGVLSRHGDWTASGLWDLFESRRINYPQEGCLVFWRSRSGRRIVHVEYCLDDTHTLGASGGDFDTGTVEDAMVNNAFIKMRPFRSRANIAGFCNPFMEYENYDSPSV